MHSAHVAVRSDAGSPLSPYLHAALTEHFGYGIYGGIWDQQRNIPRADVQAAVRALGITMFRYPGGCFSDWYHWRDGVGPRESRPTHDRTYWTEFNVPGTDPGFGRLFGPVETNAFGTDEFLRYCLDTDVEPMLVANFGSGSPAEAADWVRYCNKDQKSPRPVRWWSVGNEVFGPWEIGHCSGAEYGKKLAEFSAAMRAVDPGIRIVAVGEAPHHETSTWNTDVLLAAAESIDALSVHFYFPGPWIRRSLRDDEGDFRQIATGADELGPILDKTLAQIDAVVGEGRQLPIALDEWNMWSTWDDLLNTTNRLADAPLFAGFFNRMFERAGRVRFAMVSHLVNCMAPIQTDGDRMFVTVGYLVQQLYRHEARANAAAVLAESGVFDVPEFTDLNEQAKQVMYADGHGRARQATELDCSATADSTGVTVFLANRLLAEPLSVTVSGLPARAEGRLRYLAADGPWARNTVDAPNAVGLRTRPVDTDAAGSATIELPPHTVAALAVDHPDRR